jgi:hypothetical protein
MSIKDMNPLLPGTDGLAGEGDDQLRGIKADVQECFPEVDGLIENINATGDPGDTNPPDAATFTALFAKVAQLEANVGTAVIGEVKGWYGNAEDIPAGWFICDGTNGTPNMIGRFMLMDNRAAGAYTGLPQYDIASSGGNLPSELTTGEAGAVTATVNIDDHLLLESNFPEHNHFVGFANASPTNTGPADATHSINTIDGGGDGEYRLKRTNGVYDSEEANAGLTSKYGTPGAADPISHVVSDVDIAAHTHTLDGASLPPWHAMYFIQYKGV